ncbi:MAG: septal ring lytic transglycosylase RlpA family protein [Chitinivibrionales bacterium]|nr:septal ring lytic transglycosylase RlpA family protein [Chitinivibrionales bacterium]
MSPAILYLITVNTPRRKPIAAAYRLFAVLVALALLAECTSSARYTRDNPTPAQQTARTEPSPKPRRKTPPRTKPQPSSRASFSGVASYYGPGFHGKQTANGERFDMHGMTAAHRTLPFGTRLRVTNRNNGKSVVVRVNDRGPFKKGRVLDVSYGAAKRLDMLGSGTAPVDAVILE